MAEIQASIVIHRFYTDYQKPPKLSRRADPAKLAVAKVLHDNGASMNDVVTHTGWELVNGKWTSASKMPSYKPVEWVEISPRDQMGLQKTPLRVDAIKVAEDEDGDPTDQAWMYRKVRWDAIRPAYEAWKNGQEVPDQGTPLGAWPGITSVQAEHIRALGIRTVEEFRDATPETLFKARMPGLERLQKMATQFLIAANQQQVADEISAKDSEIEALRANQAAMAEAMQAMTRQVAALMTAKLADKAEAMPVRDEDFSEEEPSSDETGEEEAEGAGLATPPRRNNARRRA